MKIFRNLMLMLALALVFVGAMSVTKASAEEVYNIKYDEEYVVIEGADKQVYYQVVKTKEAAATVKEANWIPAAKSDNKYYIDFSALANSKDAFIAYTTDNTTTSGTPIAIDAAIKSVKVTLNYATETLATNNIDEIISKVTVKPIEGDEKKDIAPTKYAFLWKRGANGIWEVETEFNQLEWDMVKASNATLYISVAGGDGETDNPTAYTYRPSKEVKVKIPKAAKAPNVKVDFTKGTVALKNGMQVRKAGDTAWVDVAPYDKNEKENAKIFGATATMTKVSSIAVGDLLTELSITDAAKDVELEVRTAATDKKFPSAIGTLTFKTPAAATACGDDEISYVKADKAAKVVAEFTLDFTEILSGGTDAKYEEYEYILVDAEDAKVDFAKQKWTKIPEGGKVDLKGKIEAKTKYVAADGTTKEFDYSVAKAVLVRKAADKANGLFPSAYVTAKLTITETKLFAVKTPQTLPTGVTEISYKVGEGTALKAKKDDKVTLTIELEEGYAIETVKAGETTVTATEGVYSFNMPESDVEITVTVKAPAATE